MAGRSFTNATIVGGGGVVLTGIRGKNVKDVGKDFYIVDAGLVYLFNSGEIEDGYQFRE